MNEQTNPVELQQKLTKYLQNQVAITQDLKVRNKWHYGGFGELVLEHGSFMVPQPGHRAGLPKLCYYNCQQLAFEEDDTLIYVEGYAIPEFISFPVSHAWLLTPEGFAIDPTWDPPGTCYFGIPFASQWVKSLIRSREQKGHTNSLSIFEGNYLENFSLLQDGLPPEAIVNINPN